ncbi:unnamed protein product [Rangifer tarandus platyrhynchus]|uniref:Uncharacterized protein n=2 Tax=Rangifer tarandus platyrhynchus TaxID=3082113 RepID=A0ABN8YNT1_RANTA|nr:unnamed protein product [Rangifer tarandus platyrhynchus]
MRPCWELTISCDRSINTSVRACVLSHFSHVWFCDPMDRSPPGSSVHGDSLGKKNGVGCHALFQGVFPTQGSNPLLLCLLPWQTGSLPLVPQTLANATCQGCFFPQRAGS